MKTLKFILYSTYLLITLFVFLIIFHISAYYYVKHSFDIDGNISQSLKSRYNIKKLEISYSIEYKFALLPHFNIRSLSIYNENNLLLSASNVNFDISIYHLLTNEYPINKITIDRLNIYNTQKNHLNNKVIQDIHKILLTNHFDIHLNKIIYIEDSKYFYIVANTDHYYNEKKVVFKITSVDKKILTLDYIVSSDLNNDFYSSGTIYSQYTGYGSWDIQGETINDFKGNISLNGSAPEFVIQYMVLLTPIEKLNINHIISHQQDHVHHLAQIKSNIEYKDNKLSFKDIKVKSEIVDGTAEIIYKKHYLINVYSDTLHIDNMDINNIEHQLPFFYATTNNKQITINLIEKGNPDYFFQATIDNHLIGYKSKLKFKDNNTKININGESYDFAWEPYADFAPIENLEIPKDTITKIKLDFEVKKFNIPRVNNIISQLLEINNIQKDTIFSYTPKAEEVEQESTSPNKQLMNQVSIELDINNGNKTTKLSFLSNDTDTKISLEKNNHLHHDFSNINLYLRNLHIPVINKIIHLKSLLKYNNKLSIINMNIENILINDLKIDKISLIYDSQYNNKNINNILIKSENNNFSGEIKIPNDRIAIFIDGKKIDYHFLDIFMSTFPDTNIFTRDFSQWDLPPEDLVDIIEVNEPKNELLSILKYFNLRLDANIETVYINKDIKLLGFFANIESKNNNIAFNQLLFKYNESEIDIKANNQVMIDTINTVGNFKISNYPVSEAIKVLLPRFTNYDFKGYTNIAGSFSSSKIFDVNGLSIINPYWLNYMNTSIIFEGYGGELPNISIKNISDDILIHNDIDTLDVYKRRIFNPKYSSDIKYFNGAFTLKNNRINLKYLKFNSRDMVGITRGVIDKNKNNSRLLTDLKFWAKIQDNRNRKISTIPTTIGLEFIQNKGKIEINPNFSLIKRELEIKDSKDK